MLKMKSFFFLLSCLSLAVYAAQDYNSSRSNNSSIIADNTAEELRAASAELIDLGDNIDPRLVKEFVKIERKAAHLKERMLIDTFVKGFFANIKKFECRGLKDQNCITKAVELAEKRAYRLVGSQGDEGGTLKGSTRIRESFEDGRSY